MKSFKYVWFLMVALMLVATGCASGPKHKSNKSLGAPDWVDKGSGAYGGDSGKVFYGVQSAPVMNSLSLQRSAADNRARAEVAKVFEVYIASLEKDFTDFTGAGDKGTETVENVRRGMKTVVAATLSGVEIVDHWLHPDNGEQFSLARLDLAAMKNNIDKAKEISSKMKEYIRQRADSHFDDLEKEEAKKKEGK